jgi:hypothetical protein
MQWTADDIITSDKYLKAFPNDYYKTDVFYTNHPFTWRDGIQKLPESNARLLVSGHSDYPIVDEIASRYPNACWYSVNTQTPRVNGLPLGITNNTEESELHPIYGNTDVMVDVARAPRSIQNLVYMNFSVGTYPVERDPLWNTMKDKQWVTAEMPENSLEGRKRFLQNARNHSFVLCPRGNGIDTHRLWETLYMGSIPIVRRDIAHSGWTDLPILFVDSWEEVTEEMLREELERMKSKEWNIEKILIGYWIDRIRNESWNNCDSN